MFFYLSKIFWLLAQPVSIVLVFIIIAFLLLAFGRRRLGLGALLSAGLVLVLSAYTSLGYMVIQPLEDRFSTPATLPDEVSAIVVLGGATHGRPSTARHRAELNDAGDRLTEALFLARRFPDASVILSGGGGLFDDETEAEAETMRRFFVAQGISADRLVSEGASRNTDENSAFSADLLADRPGAVLLVTSAFHMPRSVGLFAMQGVEVVPWPSDYRSSGHEGLGIDLANPVNNINVLTVATKEWIGLVAYRLTGRTADLFPAPAEQ